MSSWPSIFTCRECVFGVAFFEAPQDRAEAQAESLDENSAPLRDGKVPEFVEEDDQPQAQRDIQNVQDRIENFHQVESEDVQRKVS